MPKTKEEEQEEVKKETKPSPTFTVGEIVTGTAPAVFCGDRPVTIEEGIALILNKLEKIEKSVA